MKKLIYFSLSIIISFSSFAQQGSKKNKKSKIEIKADEAFLVQNYYDAAALFREAYLKEKNRAKKSEFTFRQAECWRLVATPQALKKSESMYKRAIKTKYPYPEVYLRYAQVLQLQEKFEDALIQFKKYKQLKPNDNRGQLGISSCEFAVESLKNPSKYQIKPLDIANSSSNDFAPSFAGDYDILYFTSSRDGGVGKAKDGNTGQSFTDLWSVKREKGKTKSRNKNKIWSTPALLPEPMNTEAHEATSSFNKRGNEMFFTRCEQNSKQKESITCEIYFSKKKGKGWTSPVLLPLPYDSISTFGHPCISPDGKFLYFASDMPGGQGGKDIWMMKKVKRDEWSTPINLGDQINTPGDELYPFIHPNGDLYFASNGHIGMGGMDIFKADFDDDGTLISVSNMKSPINSSTDDFGIIFEEKFERGYFTSNRPGGKGGDDIYQFNFPQLKLSLKGVVTEPGVDGGIIVGADVSIVGTDGTTSSTKTDNSGRYEFGNDIIKYDHENRGASYEISVSKENYLSNNGNITTYGVEFGEPDKDGNYKKSLSKDFILQPIKQEIVISTILYDFNSAQLRPESKIALDAYLELLNNNKTVVVELQSHTDFIAGTDFNIELSQRRAQVCVDYLVSKGIEPKRLIAIGMGETVPFVMNKKDGKLKLGSVLDEAYINTLKREKDREKAHQYNRRTIIVPRTDIMYNPDTGEILKNNK